MPVYHAFLAGLPCALPVCGLVRHTHMGCYRALFIRLHLAAAFPRGSGSVVTAPYGSRAPPPRLLPLVWLRTHIPRFTATVYLGWTYIRAMPMYIHCTRGCCIHLRVLAFPRHSQRRFGSAHHHIYPVPRVAAPDYLLPWVLGWLPAVTHAHHGSAAYTTYTVATFGLHAPTWLVYHHTYNTRFPCYTLTITYVHLYTFLCTLRPCSGWLYLGLHLCHHSYTIL